MPLVERSEAFNHPEWIYEIKYDGFRALAYIDDGQCQLVSRKGNIYKSFSELCEWIGQNLPVLIDTQNGDVVRVFPSITWSKETHQDLISALGAAGE